MQFSYKASPLYLKYGPVSLVSRTNFLVAGAGPYMVEDMKDQNNNGTPDVCEGLQTYDATRTQFANAVGARRTQAAADGTIDLYQLILLDDQASLSNHNQVSGKRPTGAAACMYGVRSSQLHRYFCGTTP